MAATYTKGLACMLTERNIAHQQLSVPAHLSEVLFLAYKRQAEQQGCSINALKHLFVIESINKQIKSVVKAVMPHEPGDEEIALPGMSGELLPSTLLKPRPSWEH